ncbi:MAG TPA: nucleotidyltransferase family protein [Myxococcales bacterium]|nr:nucleotidyltransferase family protein [Myxococcales bacterium]
MVLCAGFGTRLRPLTDRVPKPLVPLCGVPLLRYNFALLKNAGVREIVINTHHLGATMARGAQAIASELDLDLQVSREEKQILGTGGGVRRAQAMLGAGTFLLMNGDMIFDLDLAAALAAHRKAGAAATMVLAPYPRGATYGAVEVDAQMNVRRVAGRGAQPDPSLSKLHFTGVHVLEPELIARLPAEGESDINRTAYVRAIHDGARVHGFLQRGYWGDLGAPRSLLRAHLDVLEKRIPLQRFRPEADPFDGCEERAPGVFVHPTAQVEAPLAAPVLIQAGAAVAPGAVVGSGVTIGAKARIDAGAHLERAVVWEGTHVAAGERLVEQIAAPGVRLDCAP